MRMNKSEVKISKEQRPQNNVSILRARRKFTGVVRRLPQESQDFVTDMTNIFSEPDVYNRFKADPQNIQNFRLELAHMGLRESKIRVIMNYFNFPYEKQA
jgi:uncharacterized protein YcgI (DUF1989 family)